MKERDREGLYRSDLGYVLVEKVDGAENLPKEGRSAVDDEGSGESAHLYDCYSTLPGLSQPW